MDHISVMINQVIKFLDPKEAGVYFDCTFGAGGYSDKILETGNISLYAIDQDPTVQKYVQEIVNKHPQKKFVFIKDNFSNLKKIAEENSVIEVDGIVFDLGISSMQIDKAERGFSFKKDAPLDMRMSGEGRSASEVVNKFSESDLADIIFYYSDERFARRIAKAIVQQRKVKPINTTLELAKIVNSVVKRQGRIDPATKTFQALRVFVNDELGSLKKALESSYDLLKDGGNLVVVTFQGLEDKVVKEFAKTIKGKISKSYKPDQAEIINNPRARSAKLRVITKTKGLR